jgi:hypothetical protein
MGKIEIMKLFFLLVRRVPPVSSPVLLEVFQDLSRRGFDVETGIAEEMVLRSDRMSVEHDLYLLKSHTELSLSLAGILSQAAQSLPLLHRYTGQNPGFSSTACLECSGACLLGDWRFQSAAFDR